MKRTLWQRGGSFPLLIALLTLFLIESVSDVSSRLMLLAHVVVLGGGAYALARDRRVLVWSIVLLVPAGAARASFVAAPHWGTLLAAQGFGTLFLGIVTLAVFGQVVLQPGRVTHDRLAGAVCVYLLLGLIGAGTAEIIELLMPASYNFPEPLLDAGDPFLRTSSSTYVYFSFVTLATLGYGDVTPVSPPAKTLSWMLAVTGQLYVAIIVARLVSLGFGNAEGVEDRAR
jgi:hypothetical protein